jgi:hypothetical protein
VFYYEQSGQEGVDFCAERRKQRFCGRRSFHRSSRFRVPRREPSQSQGVSQAMTAALQ